MGPEPGAGRAAPSQVTPGPLAARQKRSARSALCIPENTWVSLIPFKKYSQLSQQVLCHLTGLQLAIKK